MGGDRAHVTALLRGMTWVCGDRKGHRAGGTEDRLAARRIGWRHRGWAGWRRGGGWRQRIGWWRREDGLAGA
eukprot:scaffold43596_cov82-Phaeocystis_antarctica.AAC.2